MATFPVWAMEDIGIEAYDEFLKFRGSKFYSFVTVHFSYRRTDGTIFVAIGRKGFRVTPEGRLSPI